MDTYCQRQGIDQSSIRFLYDGNRIREDQTPGEVYYNYIPFIFFDGY